MSAPYLGDYVEDAMLDFEFTTHVGGTPTQLAGSPALSVYKANGTTESTAGVTLNVDWDTRTGLNHVRIDLSNDAFYAIGNDYAVVITAGTVGGNSVVGYVLAHFSIENRYSDMLAINSSKAAAVLLALSAGIMIAGTVDNTAFTPTATEFECDDITDAQTNLYKGRVAIFTSGGHLREKAEITAYTLTGGRGHFTVETMSGAPANNETCIIV